MSKSTLENIPTEAPKKGKSNIPTLAVTGTAVSRYAQASDDMKAASAIMEQLAPELQAAGLDHVFEHNVEHGSQPDDLITSVYLVDQASAKEELELVDRVRFSWTVKNLKNDPKAVQSLFEQIRDVNGKKVLVKTCCDWELKASFDAKVFQTQGVFCEVKFTAFKDAVDAVAAKFKVESPLDVTKVLVPKADFQQRRFALFDEATNKLLTSVLPTGTSLTPIRPVIVG